MGYDRQATYRKAEDYRARRKYRRALKEYLRIIEMDPEDQQVISRLAEVFRLLGNKQEAINYYEKAADFHYKDDRLDKAAPLYRQLVDLDRKTLRRYQDLGEVLIARGHGPDAVKLYTDGAKVMRGGRYLADRVTLNEWILEIDAKQFAARFALIKLLRKNSEPEQALRHVRQGLRMLKGRRRRKWLRKYRWQLFRLKPSIGNYFGYLFGRSV